MPRTPPAAGPPPGLLLVRGEAGQVARWAARGLVAVHTLPLSPWTVLLPAEPSSRANPPYDDPAAALAGRPVGPRLRPAIGFFVVDRRAVVTVHPSGWRAVQRWLVWEPGHGVAPTAGLAPARASDLLLAAGAPGADGPVVARVLGEKRGSAVEWLLAVLTSLGLPGADLLGDAVAATRAGARLVEPDPASVSGFEALVDDEAGYPAGARELG